MRALFTIPLLASLLASIAIITVLAMRPILPKQISDYISINKGRLWFVIGATMSFMLFLYSMTYWGDRGAIDFARIPLGKEYEVVNVDWTINANIRKFRSFSNNRITTTHFNIYEDYVVGNIIAAGMRDTLDKNKFFVLNTKKGGIMRWSTFLRQFRKGVVLR